jgi:predicted dienelactone hydrolase
MSFALTSLMSDPGTRDLFEHSQVVAAGHSFGGWTSWTLAGGNDNVCDLLKSSGDTPREETCVPIAPDPRFKGIISLDGSNDWMKAGELARVHVPTLSMGEDDAAFAAQGIAGYEARAHAFIGGRSSFRIDVNHSTHVSFTDACANFDILTRAGAYPNERMTPEFMDILRSTYCACPTGVLNGDCVIDVRLGHDLITKYMIAFTNAYVAHGPGRNLLVPKCGQKQEANIELFTTEVGGDHHLGPDIFWLPPLLGAEQYDYYVHQSDVPCEDE